MMLLNVQPRMDEKGDVGCLGEERQREREESEVEVDKGCINKQFGGRKEGRAKREDKNVLLRKVLYEGTRSGQLPPLSSKRVADASKSSI